MACRRVHLDAVKPTRRSSALGGDLPSLYVDVQSSSTADWRLAESGCQEDDGRLGDPKSGDPAESDKQGKGAHDLDEGVALRC